MEAATGLSIASLLLALLSAGVAAYAVRQAKKLQANQWSRNELELRRDVLRRFLGYRYRLAGGFTGTDGEPFIALNEAWVVFANYPDVISALAKMHDELSQNDRLIPNIVNLVQAMAVAAEIPTENLSYHFIEYPFTPPANKS